MSAVTDPRARAAIKRLILDWREEFDEIKERLIAKGGDAGGMEYNLSASEAMRLAQCISDITDLLVEDD